MRSDSCVDKSIDLIIQDCIDPAETARDIAHALNVPLGYLYCDDDRLAEIILVASELPASDQEQLLKSLRERLEQLKPASRK